MQKVTNNNHVKFDIHMLDNMEVTNTFMFNLHIQTILAKIMWDACRTHCLDHRSVFHMETDLLWAKFYLPPSPHAMLFIRKGLPKSCPTLHWGGGKGGGGRRQILQQFGKKAQCPTHFGQDCKYMAYIYSTPRLWYMYCTPSSSSHLSLRPPFLTPPPPPPPTPPLLLLLPSSHEEDDGPFAPKSDHVQISPAAPEILHHTV